MRFSIPKGWRKRKLADIAHVQTGVAKGKKNIADPVERPYLRVANVQDGYLDLTEIKTIEISRHEIERFSLQDDDVLFTEGGDFDKLGRGTVWRGEVPNCVHQNHVFAVRMKNGEMLPYYLATYASSFWGRTYFLSCSKQTTNLASINSTQLKEMPLPVPPLPEQKKIAAILSTWDRAIELTEKLIAAKQKRKQALMQKLLTGKVRFKEFVKSKGFQRTPVGDMPADWKKFRLDKVVARVKRKNPHGEVHVLTASGEFGLVDQREFFNRSVAGADLSTYYLLKRGEFAYNRSSMKGYPFGAIKRLDRYELGVLSTLYICFGICDERCDSDYLCHFFEARLLDKQLRGVTQVGGRAHGLLNITDGDFYSVSVVLPSIEEQRKIAAVLCAQSGEVETLRRKLDVFKQQKKGLMQQLLTGKVRVNVDSKMAKG